VFIGFKKDEKNSSVESDELDRQIREFLANQQKGSNNWTPNSQENWAPAPQVLVGESIQDSKVVKSKSQKKNATRRNKKGESTEHPTNGISDTSQKTNGEKLTTKAVNSPPPIQSPAPYTPVMDLSSQSNEDNWTTVSRKKNSTIPQSTPLIPQKSIEFDALKEQNTEQQKVMQPQPETVDQTSARKIKNCQKLLKQITEIEKKEKEGAILNEDQKQKKNRKQELEQELRMLKSG